MNILFHSLLSNICNKCADNNILNIEYIIISFNDTDINQAPEIYIESKQRIPFTKVPMLSVINWHDITQFK